MSDFIFLSALGPSVPMETLMLADMEPRQVTSSSVRRQSVGIGQRNY